MLNISFFYQCIINYHDFVKFTNLLIFKESKEQKSTEDFSNECKTKPIQPPLETCFNRKYF